MRYLCGFPLWPDRDGVPTGKKDGRHERGGRRLDGAETAAGHDIALSGNWSGTRKRFDAALNHQCCTTQMGAAGK